MTSRPGLFTAIALVTLAGCSQDQPEAPRRQHYGEVMAVVGQRFEMLGRAAAVRRWELAGFELDELEEMFADLPGAQPPEHQGQVDLRALEQAFLGTDPPELRAALAAHDATAFAAAFARAAAMCNACHQASTHAFIEIPSEPGAAVPRMDPVP